MSNFSFILDTYQRSGMSGIISSEMYLNGHLTTQAELDALFGNNNPSQLGLQSASFLQ